jgi:transcriptional regulator with XRE-family HTH domain
MSGFSDVLRDEFSNKEFRDSYVAENARRGLAYQITALREARGWSQSELGRQAGLPPSNVNRWEDPTYGKFSLTTLLNIASIYDVALIVKFVSFDGLLGSVSNLRPENFAIPTYDECEENKKNAQPADQGLGAWKAFLEWPKQTGPTLTRPEREPHSAENDNFQKAIDIQQVPA